jgi:hypothetical protein
MVEPRRATIDDVWRKAEDHSLRRLPGILTGALRLVREAAPRELTVSVALQLGTGAGVAVQLLLGRELLAEILAADRVGGALSDVVPTLIAFLAVTALVRSHSQPGASSSESWASWLAGTPRTASSTWPPWSISRPTRARSSTIG